VGVNVFVGVWLGVQVAQWVSVGSGIRLGTAVMVAVCSVVTVRVGVSVAEEVLVQTGVFICVLEAAFVAVHSGEAVGGKRIIWRVPAPASIKETQEMDIKTRTIVIPK
jgi:hypothetical protein